MAAALSTPSSAHIYRQIQMCRALTQRSADNADNLVRQSEALVELLRRSQHLFKCLPRLLRVRDEELLDLFELVDAEDAPCVFAVGAGFFAEVGRVAGVLYGEICGAEPLF
jgi:hypothetical protein